MSSSVLAQEDKIKEAFEAFDTDASGALSIDELRIVMTHTDDEGGAPLSDGEIEALIREVDDNGDGEGGQGSQAPGPIVPQLGRKPPGPGVTRGEMGSGTWHSGAHDVVGPRRIPPWSIAHSALADPGLAGSVLWRRSRSRPEYQPVRFARSDRTG